MVSKLFGFQHVDFAVLVEPSVFYIILELMSFCAGSTSTFEKDTRSYSKLFYFLMELEDFGAPEKYKSMYDEALKSLKKWIPPSNPSSRISTTEAPPISYPNLLIHLAKYLNKVDFFTNEDDRETQGIWLSTILVLLTTKRWPWACLTISVVLFVLTIFAPVTRELFMVYPKRTIGWCHEKLS